jgi:hypothetical protein
VDLLHTLLAVEKQGWDAISAGGGAGFYAQRLTDDAVMVVPGMVLGREETLESMRRTQPWSWYRIDDPRIVELTGESAALVYRAAAQREGAPQYTALITSLYVNRAGAWKLALHQQTPIEPA